MSKTRRPTSTEPSPRSAASRRPSTRQTEAPAGGSPVPVHIRSFGVEVNPEARNDMRQKVARRFRKFTGRIERVSIRFRDVNGPRGGVDQACRVKVVLKDLPSVVFESQDLSLAVAFGGALTGAERKVRRTLERRRTKPIKKNQAPLLDQPERV